MGRKGHDNNDLDGEDYELEIEVSDDDKDLQSSVDSGPPLHPSIRRIKASEGLLPSPRKVPISPPKRGSTRSRSGVKSAAEAVVPAAVGKIERDESELSLDEIISIRKIPKPPESYVRAEQGRINAKEGSDSQDDVLAENSSVPQKREENVFRRPLAVRRPKSASSVGSSSTSLRSFARGPRMVQNVRYAPTGALRLLANEGFLVVLDVSEMKDEKSTDFVSRRWRACYYSGREHEHVQGVAEAPRKALAKEAAALNFMHNLSESSMRANVPNCAIPKGDLIHPYVMRALEDSCHRLKLGKPVYTEGLTTVNGKDKYEFTIHVNGVNFIEASYNIRHAKLCAAKRAYDAINEGKAGFRYDEYFMGEACLDESLYRMVESEELHVCYANKTFAAFQRMKKLETLKRKRANPAVKLAKKPRNVVEPQIPKFMEHVRKFARDKTASTANSVESVGSSILSVL